MQHCDVQECSNNSFITWNGNNSSGPPLYRSRDLYIQHFIIANTPVWYKVLTWLIWNSAFKWRDNIEKAFVYLIGSDRFSVMINWVMLGRLCVSEGINSLKHYLGNEFAIKIYWRTWIAAVYRYHKLRKSFSKGRVTVLYYKWPTFTVKTDCKEIPSKYYQMIPKSL